MESPMNDSRLIKASHPLPDVAAEALAVEAAPVPDVAEDQAEAHPAAELPAVAVPRRTRIPPRCYSRSVWRFTKATCTWETRTVSFATNTLRETRRLQARRKS